MSEQNPFIVSLNFISNRQNMKNCIYNIPCSYSREYKSKVYHVPIIKLEDLSHNLCRDCIYEWNNLYKEQSKIIHNVPQSCSSVCCIKSHQSRLSILTNHFLIFFHSEQFGSEHPHTRHGKFYMRLCCFYDIDCNKSQIRTAKMRILVQLIHTLIVMLNEIKIRIVHIIQLSINTFILVSTRELYKYFICHQ